MKIDSEKLEKFILAIKSRSVAVTELITPLRANGFDRNQTTTSKFTMKVTEANVTAGGTQLQLWAGWDTVYAIGLGNVSRFLVTGEIVEFDEDFESKTRRQTQIKLL